MKKMKFLFCAVMCSLLFFACDDDDDNNNPHLGGHGHYLMGTLVSNADGMGGSAYVQLIEDLKGECKLKNSLPFSYGAEPRVYQNWLFDIPCGNSNTIKKYVRNENGLTLEGSFDVQAGSYPVNLHILNKQKAYLSLMSLGHIVVFNPTTMKRIKNIDISEYASGDKCPDASAMIDRDGLLYVGLNQQENGFYPHKDRPYCDILIINTKTDVVEKHIVEKTTNFSTATRPIDHNTLFIDENNDLYVITMAAFGKHGDKHLSGILRIKSGETEFDPEYAFQITNKKIKGESNQANYIVYAKYFGNGKVAAFLNMPAYAGKEPCYATDKTSLPVILDLKDHSITALDLPRSLSMSSLSQIDNIVYFGLSTKDKTGFYTYNIATGETSDKPVFTCEGDPIALEYME